MTRNCEYYQGQFLDHLYGLLDADESLAVIEHAGQCDECRGALLKADSQRHLLAAAARSEFAHVTFAEPGPDELGRTLKMPERKTAAARRNWGRWAMAAGILLAVGAVAFPVARHVGSFLSAQGDLDRANEALNKSAEAERQLINNHQAALTRAAEVLRDTDKRRLLLEGDQKREIDGIAESLDRLQMYMVVTGPENLRPGETNTFKIDIKNLKGNPEPAVLTARLREQTTGRVLYEQKDIKSTGSYLLALAPEVSLRAGSNVALEVSAKGEGGVQGELLEKLALVKSAYVTHLATDKPMYQPGETVFFRSLTLERSTMRPPQEDFRLLYSLTNPQGASIGQWLVSSRLTKDGKEVLGPDKQPIRGIGAGEFLIADDMDGGEYVLKVEDPMGRFSAEKRKFIVNRYQKPRLAKVLKGWSKPSYSAGDEVVANLEVTRAEGGLPLAGQPVIATYRVDGQLYKADGTPANSQQEAEIKTGTDAFGAVTIRFKLPAKIEKGDGSLVVQFSDGGGNFEPLTKPITILTNKMQMEFFPEGGDLVAGVPNRVYFQARTPLDKPADMKGQIVDPAGKVVAVVQTLNDDKEPGVNQGQGSFTFTPAAGVAYELKITEPAGIEGKVTLPGVKVEGVALTVPTGVTKDNEPIKVVVHSAGKDRELMVGAYCRGRLLDFQQLPARANQPAEVSLKPADGAGGVYRITVFEKNTTAGSRAELKPVAERLVYRAPTAKLNLAVRTSDGKREFSPGDKVNLTVTAGTESGQAAPAVVLVGVVDKSVLTMADEKTARTMPTHFFLTTEVRRAADLEYADVLVKDHPKAPQALDLLLGTQGWRRFLESDPKRFQDERKGRPLTPEEMRCQEDVDRLLVVTGRMGLGAAQHEKAVTSHQMQHKAVLEKYRPKFETLQSQMVDAEATLAALKQGVEFEEEKEMFRTQHREAKNAYLVATARLNDFDDANQRLRSQMLLFFGLILLFAGVGSLLIGVSRNLKRALPYYATAVGSVAVCGLMLLCTFFTGSDQPQGAAARKSAAVAKADPRLEWDRADRGGEPVQEAAAIGGGNADPQARFGHAANRELQQAKQLYRLGDDRPRNEPRPEDGRPAAPPPGVLPQAMAAGRPAEAPPGRNGFKQDEAERLKAATGAPVAKYARDAKGEGKAQGQAQPMPGLANMRGAAMPKAPMKDLDRAAGLAGPGEGAEQMLRQRRQNLQMDALERNDAHKKLAEQLEKAKENDKVNLKEEARKETGAAMVPVASCILREYAHQRKVDEDPEVRSDFAETLYWHPALVLANGTADIGFELCDSATTFQVVVMGHTLDGRLGQTTFEIQSKKPFSLEPKVPLEATANDVIDMPVAVKNATNDRRTVNVAVELKGFTLVSPSRAETTLQMGPQSDTRLIFRIKPAMKEGKAEVVVKGTSQPFGTDKVRFPVKIVPEGFPTTEQFSDLLEGGVINHNLTLPKEWVPQTLKVELNLYPSTLTELQKGLEGLLREPSGCFEQSSTSNYPNVLILQYLRNQPGPVDPNIEQRAKDLLTRGYGKLVSFECQTGQARQGYEWFGGRSPAHEALTAYGLLQFRDMARIGYPVDKEMLERTRQYLASQKDGQGGFKRNARALDTFGRAPDHITNAYIVWAITESELDGGIKEDLEKEIALLIKQTETSKDPYFIALVANSLLNRGMKEQGSVLLKRLAEIQAKDGSLPGAETSITRSGGRDLLVETTALAVMAWLKDVRVEQFSNVKSAVKWIGQQRGGHGGFGSTQSTILALKALLAFTKGKNPNMEAGDVTIKVNGKAVKLNGADSARFDPDKQEPLAMVIDADAFKAGGNEVEVELTAKKNTLPFTLTWSYSALTPKAADACPIKLSTKLDRANAKDGEGVSIHVTVQNTAAKDTGMVVAIVGLPAGLELPSDFAQLKNYAKRQNDDKDPGVISFFEVRGTRELVIYWRALKPNQKVDLHLDLLCKVPGEYRGPASRAYLYYNADTKHWIDPIQMVIGAK